MFKYYGLAGLGGKANVVFLSALAEMLKKTETIAPIAGVLGNATDTFFSDVENERQLFAEKVTKLLKMTKRKNIVFFIDDADRTDIQNQVLQLLGEFSSINGLISIVSLCKKPGFQLQPKHIEPNEKSDCIDMESNTAYNSIDKYLHVSVDLEPRNRIEYEKSIKGQIIIQNRNIKKPQNVYISCTGSDEGLSMFAVKNNYQTQMIIEPNHTSVGNYNLLLEILFCDLERRDDSFGKYLETVFMEYFYQSKELNPYVEKIICLSPEEYDQDVWQMRASWTNMFENDEFDWVCRIKQNACQYFYGMCDLVEAIGIVSKANGAIQQEIVDIEDMYDYYMRTQRPIPGQTWENRKESPVVYQSFNTMCREVIEPEEKETIKSLLLSRKHDEIKELLIDKVSLVSNLFFASFVLADFVQYMRGIMNNYRTFKMKLREAEKRNMNYFEYLIKEWQGYSETDKQISNMKEHYSFLKDVSLNVPSLEDFMNTILYARYVTQYGKRDVEGGRLWIYHGDKENYIIISRKEDKGIESDTVDINEQGCEKLSDKDIEEIQQHAGKIWCN